MTLEIKDQIMSCRKFVFSFLLALSVHVFSCSVESSELLSAFERRRCGKWFFDLYKFCLHFVTVCISDMKTEGLLSKLNLQCSIIHGLLITSCLVFYKLNILHHAFSLVVNDSLFPLPTPILAKTFQLV